jgi:hypothetical protein
VFDQSIVQALDLGQVENGSLIAIGVCVVIVLLVLKFISSLVVRLVMSVIFAGLGVALFSQRSSVVDCANQLREEASVSVSEEATPTTDTDGTITCTFFGQDVTIDLNGG